MSLNLLGEVSDALDDALDLDAALEAAARLTVPALGEFCAIDLLSRRGKITRISAPRGLDAPWSRSVDKWFPASPEGRHPIANVLRGGQPEVRSEPDSAQALVGGVRVPVPCSYLVTPLLMRGQRLGALSLVSWTTARRYGIEDLQLAGWLARQLALAIDNGRLSAEIAEFVALLSHRLRTPLTAVLGWVTLLRRHDLEGSQMSRGLEVIERNTRLQARVLDDLVDSTPVSAGRSWTPRTPVGIRGALAEAAEGPAAPSTERALLAGSRVLVIEDDPDTREFLRLSLEERGAVVRLAASGAEGLDLLERVPVDLILSDLMLPDGDGWSVLQAIRERGLARPPAVALSALSGPAVRAGSAAAGFAEHLAKPVDPDHLVRCLSRLVHEPGGGAEGQLQRTSSQ